ncbi:MAG: aldehyde ferredoxin oxidoreductase family protein [Candidatus Njordarchaeales archaeon]
MPGGYMGKILRVNLTKKKMKVESLPGEEILRKWLGGRGLGVYYLFEELNPKVDPLSPENKILILTGPVTGTGAPASGRWCSVTKSPLTNTVHDSQAGGNVGPEIKFAGFDGIIIEGRAEEPVYLWIHDGEAEIRDAKHLWGRTTYETTDMIREELGDKEIKTITIGPAGENLVKIAALITDKTRAAGRGGHGAVFGSKRLKAIAVRGHQKVPIANEEKFREVLADSMDKIKKSPVTSESLPKYGTAVLVNIINQHGIFPTRNFQTGVFEQAEALSGERIAETILVERDICWGCPIGCGRYTRIKEPPYGPDEGGGPEYETVWSLGADCGVSDLNAVTKANYLCNELGLDTISMGATIATLMELYEKGKIPKHKVMGIPEPKFGNAGAVVELVWRTAYRSGIGDDLAEGAARLAQKYGAPEVAMVVRMQELPAYDPRGAKGHGLAYATSNRGGCHLRAYLIAPEVLGVPELIDRFSTEGKGKWVKTFQDTFAALDSMIVCKFVTFAYGADELAAQVAAVTGWDLTTEEFLKIGERIYNAERLFNYKSFGDGKEYDVLPARLVKEPMPEGPAKGHVVELEKMLEEYYKERNWKDGRPTPEKLRELNLEKYAK